MKELTVKEMKELKEKWYAEELGICPILGQRRHIYEMVMDHQHKKKSENASEDGKGLCRGVIHFQANAWEGKVQNSFKRVGMDKIIDLPSALRNLADYLENNKITQGEHYIHPSERKKAPKLSKRSYNKLVKKYTSEIRDKGISTDVIVAMVKFPKYTGKLTKKLEKLFEKHDIKPTFNKS